MDATFENNGASLNSQFFFDTGASVTVLSTFKALEMGFDVTLDEPEFTISIVGSGGALGGVPGFFVDQITIPALGGSLVVNNVPVVVLDVTNVSDPGNIVDGIIGTNIFHGRDVVIDPNPSLGGGGASPGLYISDPVTTDFNWVSTSSIASWGTATSWSGSGVPDLLGIANVGHVSGGNQQANITSDAEAFEVNVSGGASGQQMTLRIATGAKLTTFSGVNVEDGATLELDDGTVDTQFVDLRNGAMLTGSGSIFTGSGTVDGQVENVSGTVAPGFSTSGNEFGTLALEGRFANGTSATLEIDLGGLNAGSEYDEILVDGTLSLAGKLAVSLVDFTPSIGDSFTLLTATQGVGGEFETFDLPSEYNFGIEYGENMVELLVGMPGDFNFDNIVNLADYTVWRDGLGGLYDVSHYQMWKDNFGQSLPSNVAASSVPEPAAWMIAIAAVGGVFGTRFRKWLPQR